MNQEGVESESAIVNQLKRLLLAIEVSGRAILPGTNDQLLQSIVDAAARIFGATAASLALVEKDGQNLVFRVATTIPGVESVVGMRVPIDRGIVGYVAMTGQPIAISNVREDARFNQDFARSTGYMPQSILAMPLISNDRVIGVMEVLDKINAPTFGLMDMELLAIFAQQAAIAIDQSQHFDQLGRAVLLGLQTLASQEPGQYGHLLGALQDSQGYSEQDQEILELADLFYDIRMLGEAERRMLLQVTSAFRDYCRSRPGQFGFGRI